MILMMYEDGIYGVSLTPYEKPYAYVGGDYHLIIPPEDVSPTLEWSGKYDEFVSLYDAEFIPAPGLKTVIEKIHPYIPIAIERQIPPIIRYINGWVGIFSKTFIVVTRQSSTKYFPPFPYIPTGKGNLREVFWRKGNFKIKFKTKYDSPEVIVIPNISFGNEEEHYLEILNAHYETIKRFTIMNPPSILKKVKIKKGGTIGRNNNWERIDNGTITIFFLKNTRSIR